MRNWFFFIGLILGFSGTAYSQKCDCQKEFASIQDQFIENYAGMSDFRKSHPEFSDRAYGFRKKSKRLTTWKSCDQLIESWFDYFDNEHIFGGRTAQHPSFREPAEDPQNTTPGLVLYADTLAVFRIPSADIGYQKVIDSLFLRNQEVLRIIPRWVVDIRGNGGGGDGVFQSFWPYLFTQPWILYQQEFWATEGNKAYLRSLLMYPDLPSNAKMEIQGILERSEGQLNAFILSASQRSDTLSQEQVFQNPQQVFILYDKTCISAAEQFLWRSRQSQKVTLWSASPSGGAVDYGNLRFAYSSSGNWYFSIPTTKSTRIPHDPIDPTGILPDVWIPKQVDDPLQWVIQRRK